MEPRRWLKWTLFTVTAIVFVIFSMYKVYLQTSVNNMMKNGLPPPSFPQSLAGGHINCRYFPTGDYADPYPSVDITITAKNTPLYGVIHEIMVSGTPKPDYKPPTIPGWSGQKITLDPTMTIHLPEQQWRNPPVSVNPGQTQEIGTFDVPANSMIKKIVPTSCTVIGHS